VLVVWGGVIVVFVSRVFGGLVLVVLLGLVFVASAFAAGPEAPVTGSATAVTAEAATLHGVLNPGAAGEPGSYVFDYAPGGVSCTEGAVAPEPAGTAAGSAKEAVSVSVVGLLPSTLYTVCLVARNAAEEPTVGSAVTFTTSGAPPAVESEAVSGVSSTSATLEGTLNPENQETMFSFEYATNEAFTGAVLVAGSELVPAVFAPGTPVSAPTGVLVPGTTYFYRLDAKNGTPPTSEGPVQSFTTVPAPATDAVSEVLARTATFNGHVTLGAVVSGYSFAYSAGGECAGGQSTPVTSAGTGSSSTPESAGVSGLLPNTEYTVCMVTSNAFGVQAGNPVAFKTPFSAPLISEQEATQVTATTAILGAEVNPGDEETTYFFEYGTGGTYTHSTPVGPVLPADNAQHVVSAAIEGLTPGTPYNYRLTAENGTGVEHGTEGHLTTQNAGGKVSLLDGRQYQLVSPPEKDGAQIFGITARNGVVLGGDSAVQASEDGNRITYLTSAPVGNNPPGNAAATQALSTRNNTTWNTTDISQRHKEPVTEVPLEVGELYRLFSGDLTQAVLEDGITSEILLRDNQAGLTRGLPAGELPPPVEFTGATPDFKHILFNTTATSKGSNGVYELTGETAAQVNILENGTVAPGFPGGFTPHNRPSEFAGRHAVSDDGSHVVWGNETELFSRDLASKETVQVDAAQGGSETGGGVFQLASTDGTRVFFTDEKTLTPGAAPNSLYMYDIPNKELKDIQGPVGILQTGAENPVTERGDEVLGANDAGTTVYVTSQSVLTEAANPQGEKAVAGGGNIFVLRETPAGSGTWTPGFVATLSSLDEAGYNPLAKEVNQRHLAHLPVRVSGNGEYFAFMSDRRLTGYDNRDVNSGFVDEEVFLYGAASSGSLVCASCDPTGARPLGVFDSGAYPGQAMDPARTWAGHWLAASIPGWNEAFHTGRQGNNSFELPLYVSRVLSDSGRLFFDARDALVSQDVNGRDDVYEFEPGEVGSCGAPGAGGAGCVGLVSSGRGGGDSEFVDASVGGNDVFFITADRLVTGDTDSTVDMYDAHVCSGSAPCLAESPVVSPPCGSTDECRAGGVSQPGIFGAPASATFSGVGNLPPSPVKKIVLTVAQVRAKALKTALKACKRQHGAHRAACEARARKRYGPKAKAKKARKARNISSATGSVNGDRKVK
jgi:hypothetical protein